MKEKHKALMLFSGGLDSMLAVELLRRCGLEVAGIVFRTPFFKVLNAEKASRLLGLELRVVDITERHIE
ncbi:MAG: tRNA 4-thiouridine(8) synthase ThiI, partial [Actinomycetota bacterium]